MKNIHKLEEKIMNCWQVEQDLETLFEKVMESEKLNVDEIANMVLGIKALSSARFNSLFNTYEAAIRDYYENSRNRSETFAD